MLTNACVWCFKFFLIFHEKLFSFGRIIEQKVHNVSIMNDFLIMSKLIFLFAVVECIHYLETSVNLSILYLSFFGNDFWDFYLLKWK